ncbi:MAG: RusA family crossover junction endodeoxyribonuclease [Clostridia bacterium]
MIEFEVIGKPVGKGRPRFSGRNGVVRTYTPTTTTDYETEVAMAYKTAVKKASMAEIPPYDKPLKIQIVACYAIPQAFSRAKKEQALCEVFQPQTKPDIDNIIKIVLDGLNKVAYDDDKQIVEVYAVKRYGNVAKTIVTLSEFEE